MFSKLLTKFNKLDKFKNNNMNDIEVGMTLTHKQKSTEKVKVYLVNGEVVGTMLTTYDPKDGYVVVLCHQDFIRNTYNIPPKPFTPKEGQEFYYIGVDGDIRESLFNYRDDEGKIKLGNCFRTRVQAEAGRERIKKVIKGE